jgi:hypothetical protein
LLLIQEETIYHYHEFSLIVVGFKNRNQKVELNLKFFEAQKLEKKKSKKIFSHIFTRLFTFYPRSH